MCWLSFGLGFIAFPIALIGYLLAVHYILGFKDTPKDQRWPKGD